MELIILGIDPGIQIMGFSIIKIINNKIEIILIDELYLKKYKSHILKLNQILNKTLLLIDIYHPNEIAIESPFLGKNVKSMLTLSKAQSMAISAGLYRNIPIIEYSPKKIKMAITGNGNSSKEQVYKMIEKNIFKKNYNFNKKIDAVDALAIAICHYFNK